MPNDFERLRAEVVTASRPVSVSGLTSISAKAYTLARLRRETARRFVVVTDTNRELDEWTSDLEFHRSQTSDPEFEIVSLPSFQTDPYSGVSPHAETQERRALA